MSPFIWLDLVGVEVDGIAETPGYWVLLLCYWACEDCWQARTTIMPIVTMAFRRCVVNSPTYGSDEEHVVSRIYFDLQIADAGYVNLYVDVRQLVREGAETEPLLVSRPEGYEGPLNVQVFQCLVEFYYRQAVGEKWGMFGNTGIRMRLEDWVIEHEMLVQFEVTDEENPLEVGF